MSLHKLTIEQDGIEYVITFGYRPGRPAVRTLRNGDPGYPVDPLKSTWRRKCGRATGLTKAVGTMRSKLWTKIWRV